MNIFVKIKSSWSFLILGLLIPIVGFFVIVMGQSSKVRAENPSGLLQKASWTKTASASFRIISAKQPKLVPVSDNNAQWAALQIDLVGAAKTYWRSPGETGVPPSFDWSKSVNVKEVKIFWPAPHRFKEADSMAVGYKNDLILPLQITPKDSKQAVILNLDLFMGVCTEICIPVQQKLALALPAKGAGEQDLSKVMATIPKRLTQAQSEGYLKDIKIAQYEGEAVLVVETLVQKGRDTNIRDLFLEAPAEFYIPLSVLKEDLSDKKAGLSVYHIGLTDIEDPKALIGKPLKVTITTGSEAVEIQTALK